jgi:hypothetical protein
MKLKTNGKINLKKAVMIIDITEAALNLCRQNMELIKLFLSPSALI